MDATNATKFEEACRGWIDAGHLHLIVDLAELAYVSSMGLSTFVSVGKSLQEKNGTFRLCRLSGLVKQVFEITRLTLVFPIHESVEAAIAGV